MSKKTLATDILIIGGGVIGLTIARTLAALPSRPLITVLEKDSALGTHASTLNSGVLHSGIAYAPGSLKSKHCVQGNSMLTKYCLENNLPILQCGKLIVAKSEEELPKIDELYEKGKKNGVTVKLVDRDEALKIDPHIAKGLKFPMIWSPSTSVASPKAVFNQLEKDARSMDNIRFICNERYSKLLEHSPDSISIETAQNNIYTTKKLINCAGLYSDRIAHAFGEASHYAMLPLKGLYVIDNKPYQEYGLKTLVYSVPPVKLKGNNFWGVHTTLTTEGKLKLGPAAVPCFWREDYGGVKNFKLEEFLEIMGHYLRIGFSTKMPFYLRLLAGEALKIYRPNIVKAGQQLIDVYDDFQGDPHKNFKEGKPAIRSQLIDKRDLMFVNDFQIIDKKSHIHLLNFASPGWTSALSIAEEIKERVQAE